jgi:AcrR family transcriptional regulator
MTTEPVGCRPQRADARRNRERILCAAREAFAEHGGAAQIDDVARRAGVGVGTVYRHFPTKDDLLMALAAEHFATLAALARSALADEPDAWEAFAAFLRAAAAHQAADKSVFDILSAAPQDGKSQAARSEGLWGAVGELVDRAQAAGALRADVVPDDIPMLMCALGQADRIGPPGGSPVWPRMLALMLDGMRAGAPGQSPLPPRARGRGRARA